MTRTSIVDDKVNAIRMFVAQPGAEVSDALRLTYVKLVVLDLHLSSIIGQHFGLLELRVAVQCFESFGAAFRRSCGEVDKEGPGFEG